MPSIPFFLFIVFLVLKLTGTISWSWVWVTSPIWIALIPTVIVLVVLLCVGGLAGLSAVLFRKF